jgi:leucyl-tRNA synthetase
MSNQVYDHQQIEEKWLKQWTNDQLFQGTTAKTIKEKLYLLFAFAYPSGSGLHVGHVESKTALDILARFNRMNGKDVFFPVGWDAFGLPAENYAIKTGVPPVETTKNAIHTFRRQIKRLAISYDWQAEIATCHPDYYQWTQWLFLQLYKKGLAYQKLGKVNWCPSCQTVLANEQVVNGRCERCDSEVVQKDMKQWFFKITEYKDELISGLEKVDWPAATKHQQLNWIGKSEGAEIKFQIFNSAQQQIMDQSLEIYTTAHDTIFGCTFMVIAPEHDFLLQNKDLIKNWSEVEQYIQQVGKKTELDRQIQKDKTGIKLEGLACINPINEQKVPIYVADYVLAGYGTGAIMAVPGEDTRDYEFAQKFNIPVIFTTSANKFIAYEDIKSDPENFIISNSGEFNGLNFVEGRRAILAKLVELGAGEAKSQYKLRDWLISRQRYWGAPIPVVYDPAGNPHPVKEEHLPWLLPTDVEFKPTGESPLTYSQEFKERTERLYGQGWRPEYDTMDTFVDSSWYYLRYADARNKAEFANKQQLEKWLPVDFYMIGPEHIVLHLLYSRFFTKFLRDEGYLKFDEPFLKMRHQGMILGPDNRKMSKSKGNVINPDDVVEKFGADTLRVYEMFMGPIEADKPWDTRAVVGVYKFLSRIFRLVNDQLGQGAPQGKYQTVRKLHQTISKVSTDIPQLKFNTAIAMMMELVNQWETDSHEANGSVLTPEEVKAFLQILAPFAPFLAEELYHLFDQADSIHLSNWPTFDEKLAVDEVILLPIQVNGKMRAQLQVESTQINDQDQVLLQAKQLANVKKWIADKKVVKEIYIPGKIVNLVVV